MAATYKQFLAAPTSSLLADTASLHYVTTTTSFSGATQIIKHLNGLQKQVTKKKEDILNIVDGQDVIVVEVDTGLGFETGGGPYLPGLDDNFLSNRVAYFPITHFVAFDEDGKISQIRLQWDQGSVLKQIEVIGKSGRNWPIRDSREQIAFIQACLKSSGSFEAFPPSHNETIVRTRGNSNNALRDPHASLQLFGPREEIEAPLPSNVVSPYGGSRPHQRSFTEILGDEPVDGSPSANRHRSMSPSKGGQGKNFKPSRIFDGQQESELVETPQPKGNRLIRPNPKKFSHFDFADGTDPQDAPAPGQDFDERPKSKHDSQWSFSDFVTPQKFKPSKTLRTQDIRHWDTDKGAVNETPEHLAARPRRDAETHFELQDDGERVPQPPRPNAKPRGYTHNEGLGLYKNQLFDKEDPDSALNQPLGNITNLKGRGEDFDPHFNIADNSPAHPDRSQPLPEGRKKAVEMMDANWSSYEQSPAPKKENKGPEDDTRIHIAGDGMGGRKGTNRDWLYGESADLPQSVPGRKPGHQAEQTGNKNSRIHIAGNGMGGRSGTSRDFLACEEDDVPLPVPGRKPGHPADHTDNKTSRIHIDGNGMGGRAGTNRDFLAFEEDAVPQPAPTRKPGHQADHGGPKDTRIHIAGDGMGGKKGTNRDWLYGEVDENAQSLPTRKPGNNNNQSAVKKDFWDF
ncbi:hypothetical protein B0T10DRAFT_473402 [Thelonectria olida]|uniref:Uncharacterized protein n=1 Tax=Thelonectria olida TaxID=1576542 RepID=A0A9P8WJW0_9HYPO|nr:hypothetical protein B0T10DRAFT_473402 [Thelonectria olida]